MTGQLTSGFGLVLMIGLAWLLSAHRWRVDWRLVTIGVLVQFAIAWSLLKTSLGLDVINRVRTIFELLLACTDDGAEFAFGPNFRDHYFAFKIGATIISFGALMGLLYHFRILQFVVGVLGWFMQRTLGTSGAESLVAAANIFTGQTEAPLIIQPYLARMTRSEIMTLMVAGFATVAGGVMAAFIGMGIDAGHLLTASVISAPAAVVIAKILQPEVDEPVTRNTLGAAVKPDTINAFDALTTGAADGLRLALNITAMVIAFLALVAVVDLALTSATGVFGSPWTLADVFGWVFSPLAWAMGVDPGDERKVGELLGLKTVANEFLAYDRLATMQDLGPRSKVIAVYALCGFANLGSVGVQIGGLSLLAPSRRADFATLGWRAMLGGNLACFMTACIAGLLI
ncbi:NupC/NupG family nucleoside CNT transporter [Planctellipticum variicoloris]|uniref:NupC/NupG family nucleoside CNT transporter n=1 Tax=Planctellipticum variicoloris TaxID=3064265 RepID=UPI003013EB1D|nr:hypothetical protein SH412_000775 [Planctomycetaceae bacterium SH412]